MHTVEIKRKSNWNKSAKTFHDYFSFFISLVFYFNLIISVSFQLCGHYSKRTEYWVTQRFNLHCVFFFKLCVSKIHLKHLICNNVDFGYSIHVMLNCNAVIWRHAMACETRSPSNPSIFSYPILKSRIRIYKQPHMAKPVVSPSIRNPNDNLRRILIFQFA